MTLHWTQYLSGATAIYCWLVAGVFLAFSDFIMKSLAAIPPDQAMRAMQSINILVFRSIFMVGLFAVSAASLMFIAMGFFNGGGGSGLLMAAGVIYLISVMGVTMAGNVPLNNELAVLDPSATDALQVWQRYLNVWVNWNHVRTLGAAAAALLMTIATFRLA
tara:strand:+ start:28074 stop:28559 length:486 start_codon:yes stop_codon:yes gene_type:complete